METRTIITIVITVAVCAAIIIIFYFLGKRNMKKRDEQQAAIDNAAQQMNMLIIDKKKLKLKESGLPAQVIEQTPWYAKRSKVPVVKAKVVPKIAVFIADNDIFELIPVKKEVKATVSGLYITDVKGLRGHWTSRLRKKAFLPVLWVRNKKTAPAVLFF
ncbi:MAG: hypothetical protein V8R80_04245 [Eubacterium sp.]